MAAAVARDSMGPTSTGLNKAADLVFSRPKAQERGTSEYGRGKARGEKMQRQASHNLTARQAAIAMPTATRLKQPTCNVEPTYCTRFVRDTCGLFVPSYLAVRHRSAHSHPSETRERERAERNRAETPLNIAHQLEKISLLGPKKNWQRNLPASRAPARIYAHEFGWLAASSQAEAGGGGRNCCFTGVVACCWHRASVPPLLGGAQRTGAPDGGDAGLRAMVVGHESGRGCRCPCPRVQRAGAALRVCRAQSHATAAKKARCRCCRGS